MSFESWNKENVNVIATEWFAVDFPVNYDRFIRNDKTPIMSVITSSDLKAVYEIAFLAGIISVRDMLEKHGLKIVEKCENDSIERDKDY